MSFMGGAECSTAANPLAQFSKHVQDDNSLQRDRLAGRPGGMQEGMRGQAAAGGQDQMMDQWLQQGQPMNAPGPAAPFAMEQMRRDLENISTPPPMQAHGPPQAAWAKEFGPEFNQQLEEQSRMEAAFQGPANAQFNHAEFARFQPQNELAAAPLTANAYQQPMNFGYGGMGMQMGMMGGGYQNMMQRPVEQDKGKERMVELDDANWEAQFAQIDAEGQKDLDAEANAAIERELNEVDRSVDPRVADFQQFERIWRDINAEHTVARDLLAEDDQIEFDFTNARWPDFDAPHLHGDLPDPQMGDYMFEDHNPFENLGDPFAEGIKIMREGGNLSLAALAFEAAVQKDPDHVDAWVMLGNAQAQNEKETPAIRALEQALKVDPNNLPAMMGLAVSYTNEGYDSTAYRTLERWLATKYPQIISKDQLSGDNEIGFTERHHLHEKVTNLFIKAAQLSPDGEHMDPDVQVGLGVLFYGAEEYAKAVDCFEAALASTESGSSNQQDQIHLLWNRLGATLANSGRSEEAISAYEKALTINPNFVRARYNLGVSCINIGCYEEAAQHLLGALAMHKVVEAEGKERVKEVVGGTVTEQELDRMIHQNTSTNLYDTLRRVFSQMQRRDLVDAVVTGMDVDIFRKEFDF